jgi:hypothetical protein
MDPPDVPLAHYGQHQVGVRLTYCAAGVPAAEIAAQLGVGRASAYRILADQKAA